MVQLLDPQKCVHLKKARVLSPKKPLFQTPWGNGLWGEPLFISPRWNDWCRKTNTGRGIRSWVSKSWQGQEIAKWQWVWSVCPMNREWDQMSSSGLLSSNRAWLFFNTRWTTSVFYTPLPLCRLSSVLFYTTYVVCRCWGRPWGRREVREERRGLEAVGGMWRAWDGATGMSHTSCSAMAHGLGSSSSQAGNGRVATSRWYVTSKKQVCDVPLI